jgi:TPR repeat protein
MFNNHLQFSYCCKNGKESEKYMRKAFKLFEMANKLENHLVRYNLAFCNENGEGF